MLLVRLTAALFLAAIGCACDGESPRGPPVPSGAGGSVVPVEECDADGDGHERPSCGGDDCDDADPMRSPAAEEHCGDGIDQNCDGRIDEGCACTPGDIRGCWPSDAPSGARAVGECRDGTMQCENDGTWSACVGAIVPSDEGTTCDGLDQNCDGRADEALVNRCGTCGELPAEVCGNGLDDDCDGAIDNAELCSFSCEGVDVAAPGPLLACCVADPATGARTMEPVRHSFVCVEAPGLLPCDARTCVALAPDAACERECGGDTCVCGRRDGGGLVADPRCGFYTPCAFLGCEGRTQQFCYSGPPQTLNVGICRAGLASCGPEGSWGACFDQVLPELEICGNGLDDDCDGLIDEADGASGIACGRKPVCPAGAVEICGNGLDDDCDGAVDELCAAATAVQSCYRGSALTRGRGTCRDGEQAAVDGVWGPCFGDVLPAGERCGDGLDTDCNGLGGLGAPEDPGCGSAEEVCNGVDDDGDGRIDEDLGPSCGTCPGTCERHSFASPGSCGAGDRTCTLIESLGGAHETITVAADKRFGDPGEVLYLVRSPCRSYDCSAQRLVQFDPARAAINWEAALPDGGTMPPRSLAIAPDNSVWIGTQPGVRVVPTEPEFDELVQAGANLYHFDRNGHLLCRADVPDGAADLVLDGAGAIWVASGYTATAFQVTLRKSLQRRHLLKFDTRRVEHVQPDGTPWPDAVPRCKQIDLDPDDPHELGIELPFLATRLSIDARGILWASAPGGFQIVRESPHNVRFDTRTLQSSLVARSFDDSYDSPLAVERHSGDVYYASGGLLVHAEPDGPWDTWATNPPFRHEHAVGTFPIGQALAFTRDGMLWSHTRAGAVVKLDPRTGQYGTYASGVESLHPYTLAEDRRGRLVLLGFVRSQATEALERTLVTFDPASEAFSYVTLPPGDWSFGAYGSLSLGVETRDIITASGRWTDVVDARYPTVRWRSLDWEESVPAGASVEAWVYFADDREGLDAVPACGPFVSPPADLTGCAGDGRRFARVEFILRPGSADARPLVQNIEASWWRP